MSKEQLIIYIKTKIMSIFSGTFIFFIKDVAKLYLISKKNPEKAGFLSNAIIADRLISNICPENGIFLDVGAQYGAIFSRAKKFQSTINVFAFEADYSKSKQLSNIYPYATIYGIAVGEKEGTATFYLNSKASGYNSLVPNEKYDKTTVRIAAIDDLLPDMNVDVIKIDIEGAELGALRGARKTIQRGRPTIMFECILPRENSLGYSAEKIWSWFHRNEYSIFTPDRVAHDAPPMGKETFLDSQQYPFRTHNYFAIHHTKIDFIKNRSRYILNIR